MNTNPAMNPKDCPRVETLPPNRWNVLGGVVIVVATVLISYLSDRAAWQEAEPVVVVSGSGSVR